MRVLEQLPPDAKAQVAAEWRAVRARERPVQPPVEDRPPVEVRGSDQSVRRGEMAEASL